MISWNVSGEIGEMLCIFCAIAQPDVPPVLSTMAMPETNAENANQATTAQPMLSPEASLGPQFSAPQFSAPQLAQAVIPDAESTGTVIMSDENRINITGGQLSGDGANLFHSFQEFGLTAEQVANFITSPDIQNILSGVNGGNPSIINGLIQVSGSNANLYLINPAGVILGPDGAISLTGSFTATTANQIGFGDTWLDILNPSTYEALTGTPNGFSFTGHSSSLVLNQGNLAVEPGQNVTLLGNQVINLGTIEAPGGTITLVAIPSENLVRISQENQLLSLEITPALTESGQLSLDSLSLPELLTGNTLAANNLTVVENADGTVRLESSTASTIAEPGGVIASGEISATGDRGGSIYLLGQQVSLLNANVDASGSFGGGSLRIGGEFQGQGRVPNARFTLVDEVSTLQADSLATGDGGSIVVWADDTTQFLGSASVRGAEENGDGGWVEVSGLNSLQFSGSVDASSDSGTTGTLLLDPTNIEIVAAGGDITDPDTTEPDGLDDVDDFGDADADTINEITRIDVDVLENTKADITLQATQDITFSTEVNLTVDLEAIANNSIFLNSDIVTRPGAITLEADADGNGTGGIFSSAGTSIQTNGGAVDISGSGLQLSTIDTSSVIPGTVDLLSTKNITFDAIAANSISADPGANVTILANGTVQGFATGTTINTQGGGISPSGTVTIQHDGGPTNAPFEIGNAAVNGTAGAIAADIPADNQSFEVLPNGGSENPTDSTQIEIISVNAPPTLEISQALPDAEVNETSTFALADLNPAIADVNNDITTLEVASIPTGTLLRNGVALQPGDAIAPTDTLQFRPPDDTSGTLTALTVQARDGVSSSAPVAVTVTLVEPPSPPPLTPPPPRPPQSSLPNVVDPNLGTREVSTPQLLSPGETLLTGMPLAQSPQLEELSIMGMVLPEPGFLIVNAIFVGSQSDGASSGAANSGNFPSLVSAPEPDPLPSLPMQEGETPDAGELQEPDMGELQEPDTGDQEPDEGASLNPLGEQDEIPGDSEGLTEEPADEPADTIPEDVAVLPEDNDASPTDTPGSEGDDTLSEPSGETSAASDVDEPTGVTADSSDSTVNQALKNCQAEAQGIQAIAGSDRTQSFYESLISCYESNLATATQQEDSHWIAYSLNNLAITHFVLGDYLTALDLHQQQLERAIALQDPTQEGIALGGIGAVYAALGDYATAIDFYERSLRVTPIETAAQWKALTYRNLGNAYFAEKEYDNAAQQQLTSLDISRGAGDTYGEMQAYGNLGSTRAIQGQFAEAIALYEQGLTLAKALPNTLEAAQILLGISTTYAYQQNYEESYRYSQDALALTRELGASLGEGIALTNLGNALLYLERLTEAEQALFNAIAVWEAMRAGLGTSDAFKVSIFETQLAAYRNLQEVLVTQNKANTALEISERGRARAFVELLARGQVNPDSVGPVPPPNLAQMQQIAAAQAATLVEYSIIRDQVAEPPHAASAQNPVEPRDAQLYIWVVSPNGDTHFRQVDLQSLLGTTSIADLVTDTRIALTGRDSSLIAANRGVGVVPASRDRALRPGDRVKREGDLPDLAPYEVVSISPDGQTVTVQHPDFVLPNPVLSIDEISRVDTPAATASLPLQQLHELLIAPITDVLPTDPDDLVIFVPQEQLFVIPFAALQDTEGTYFVEQHTLAIAPSIQTLALTTSEAEATAASDALVVGNPSPMPEEFIPLPNAELEATTVADLLSVNPLVRGAATEAEVKASLANADIIHLATHGRFNSAQPLQGALALAPDAQNDGFLTAAEILDLPLRANLAILSACDTGRGRITGDGVLGLSRSFMAAGVPQVVVSLWQVPDAQTAELMIDFHEARLDGNHTPHALRKAMLASLETYADPAIWSAFTQVGNLNNTAQSLSL
ncbi:CHAT domain-containing protein [Oscillatoria sp. CS-180]|uniref:CHAT domain-containing protein n=1 Tax=Oscillatoria sp. CS-180 TaxID=3021720 RepID=UPI00232E05AA|nr:CHAT domain-containing protein [Oscillatoria sp. CS-180]MDB9524544.1 CHAT domain-containing protein [Oscillatoria sp. CS-180]